MKYYILESGEFKFELKVFGKAFRLPWGKASSRVCWIYMLQLYVKHVKMNRKASWVMSFKEYNGPTSSYI